MSLRAFPARQVDPPLLQCGLRLAGEIPVELRLEEVRKQQRDIDFNGIVAVTGFN